jgi:hypothetical protein
VVALERDVVELDAEQFSIGGKLSDSRAIPGFEGIAVGTRVPVHRQRP